jgi:hypothetical protein
MLERYLRLWDNKKSVPVQFAANTLYVMERNGMNDALDEYSHILIDILKNKSEFLHSEGLAISLWALAQSGSLNSDVWTNVFEKNLSDKKFGHELSYIDEVRLTPNQFESASNSYFSEGSWSDFGKKLFYQGIIPYYLPRLH